jgi:TolA-binding protein
LASVPAEGDDYGVAIINTGNIACSVEKGDMLNMMLFHTAEFYGNVGNTHCDTKLVPEKKTHIFTYSLLPHAGSYREAMNLYKQLIAKTSNNERRQACRMNLLRCAYNLNESSEVLAVAGELLAAGNLSPEWTREVYYDRAKTLIRENKANEAIADLKKLAADTRTQQGAEAKYMLAQIYFNNKKYDDCEKEVLNYIEVSTPHAYWLARSFVLLADLYITLDRKMEAKQYLLSLQNNYTGNDDIAGRIKERLDKLAAEENQTVTQQ